MLCLTLVVVLILASVSAKHEQVKIERRDLRERCYGNNHPLMKCWSAISSSSEYPVLTALTRVENFDKSKSIITAEGALESLCSDVLRLQTCINNGMDGAPDECKEAYNRNHFAFVTPSNRAKAVRLIQQLCTKENIEIASANLDCVFDLSLSRELDKCSLKNPDHDCSHLEYDEGNPSVNQEIKDCYKDHKQCDADKEVKCGANKVSEACTAEAGQLMALTLNGILDIFAIHTVCPDGGRQFSTLLKFFKK